MKPTRRIVATLATAGIALGAAGVTPAFANVETDSTSSTTRRPTSSTTKPAGSEAVAFIEKLIAKVHGSVLPEATKADLLGRLADFRAQAKVGPIDTGALQALVMKINEAMTRPPTTDAPRPKPTTPRTSTTHDNDDVDDEESESESEEDREHAKQRLGLIASLDKAAAKVVASTLADADKAALLERIAALKASIESGAPLGKAEVGKLMSELREALAKLIPPPSTPPTTKTERPHSSVEQAIATIEAQIAKIQASQLPDEVKAKVIEALNGALEQIRAGKKVSGDDDGKVRDDLANRKAKRLAEMVERLSRLADRVETEADEVAALADSADVVEMARAKVAEARERLELASTSDELRAIFTVLREAKVALHEFAEATATTTTTTTTTTLA